jgi:hypothetical protein
MRGLVDRGGEQMRGTTSDYGQQFVEIVRNSAG